MRRLLSIGCFLYVKFEMNVTTLFEEFVSLRCLLVYPMCCKLNSSVCLSLRNDLHIHALDIQLTYFHFYRDAVLPVTCGAFGMYFGTCTQGPQHPDVKQMSQSVSCVRKKR